MNIKAPILITGIPRSGASMIAQAINICGAFGGTMTNKRGMFENDRIRDTIIKSYLQFCGVDEQGQYPLLKIEDSPLIPTDFQNKVEKIIKEEGYREGQWMYKDSRIGWMWQVWHYAFPDAKWIIVRRRTGDITQSCIKTGYMKAFKEEKIRSEIGVVSEEQGWIWMAHQYEEKFKQMINEGLNWKIVWPERMMYGDYKQLYETLDWVGLKWKSEVLTVIDPLFLSVRQKERR
jgi:hypothetical protein